MDAQDTIARTQDALNAKIVFGEPYEKNGITVIPAASVRGGAGGGTGEGPEGAGKGTGSGFGVGARPAGAYVIEEGTVTWKPAFDRNRAAMLASFVALAALWTFGRIARARAKLAKAGEEKP